jgi:uncharacterized protein
MHSTADDLSSHPKAWDTIRLPLIVQSTSYWEHLKDILSAGKAIGSIMHDAHVVAICLGHNVREIWTAVRDFSRFKGIRTKNPLIN